MAHRGHPLVVAQPARAVKVVRARSVSYRIRRLHRYLGVVIGVQFILWTAGGLYFSWTSLAAVHGDHLVGAPRLLPGGTELASPAIAIDAIRRRERIDSLTGVELASILDRPVYRIGYLTTARGSATRRHQLADATTGALLPDVGRAEAVEIAGRALAAAGVRAGVRAVELVTDANVGGHHEYRGQPLPAWAVTFAHPEEVTAYVPLDIGRVVRVRNDRWRRFDFLWMLHTMDYRGRDDINNVVLRTFSVLGLATILSGFALFASSSRAVRRVFRRRSAAQMSSR